MYEVSEYLGKKYAIYSQATHKIIKLRGFSFGGITQDMYNVIAPLLYAGKLWSVLNKRNGYYIERFMQEDEAKTFAEVWGGSIAVPEIVGKTCYIAESKAAVKSALSVHEYELDGEICRYVTIIRGSVNRKLQKKFDEFGVTGKRDEKRALGTYTTDVNEQLYVKGYFYGSVKSHIISKFPSKRPAKQKPDVTTEIVKDCKYNHAYHPAQIGQVIGAIHGRNMSKGQRRRLNKVVRAKMGIEC